MAFVDKMKRGFGSFFGFFADAWSELTKVKWPARKEMISYTLVVLFTVLFVTLYFYVLDIGISAAVRWITG